MAGRWRPAEGCHLAALWAFAVAQPLFDLLGRNPEFFATRGSPRADVVAFALAAALVPPAAMYGLELLVGLASERARRALHIVLVALLGAAVVLQSLDLHRAAPAFALALAAGAVVAAAYVRLSAARSFLTVLAPAPLVFLVLFLTLSEVSRLVLPADVEVQAARGSARAPVVLVVLDELPVQSLMDARGRVDARHFPNFARLAGDSTWYRNTATVHADTPYAVPAIMDGRLPDEDRLPIAADHPHSAFSLLGGDYSLHVQEEATVVCPRSLCRERRAGFGRRMEALWDDLSVVYLHMVLPGELERELPPVGDTWGNFRGDPTEVDPTQVAAKAERLGARRRPTRGARKRRLRGHLNQGRPARFEHFVAGVRGDGRPRLHFLHALLPHVPFQYLPSGRAYRDQPGEDIPGLNSSLGFKVRWLVEQGWQRHLLQAAAVDRLLGRLFDRLRRQGLYDQALVAVVADHGASFQRGHDRRWVRPGNVADIAPVPFFLKAPGQRRGRVSDEPLRTVDVLPTIADVLDIRIPWRVDGRSALGPTVPGQRRRRVIGKRFRYSVPVDVPGYEAARRASLRRKLDLFGGGLYAIGPHPELVGRSVARLAPAPSSGPRARLVRPGRFGRVDPAGGIVPVHVVGRLAGGTRGGGKAVAVAVNGRVAATGWTFSLEGSDDESFSAIVPERVLRPGRNRIELLWVRGPGRVEALGGAP